MKLPRVALLDFAVTPNNPLGSMHLQILRHLSQEFDFTVFANQYVPRLTRFVKIPGPRRPLVTRFLLFRASARFFLRIRGGAGGYDLIHSMGCLTSFADIRYVQFCHRRYLRHSWKLSRPTGLRRLLRWADHAFHSLAEPSAYRTSSLIVVPSLGLKRELEEEFGISASVRVISNPITLPRLTAPPKFDRQALRYALGLSEDDVVLVFVALGHFERKGLNRIMSAIATTADQHLKLLVVGGERDLVRSYEKSCQGLGIGGRAIFVGFKTDIRESLWIADGFIMASTYETFLLAACEAAGAGLPLITTVVSGVEEFIEPGKNAVVIGNDPESIRRGIEKFLRLRPEERQARGQAARESVARFNLENFVSGWRQIYLEALQSKTLTSQTEQ